MTLSERHTLVETVVRCIEQEQDGQIMSSGALLEVASSYLAIRHGLCVTPDEIARVLSVAASLNYRGPDAIVCAPDGSRHTVDLKT